MESKCPYCGKEMAEGQLCSNNSQLIFKTTSKKVRINDQPIFTAVLSGDAITAYECEACNKIVLTPVLMEE